jgi:hypothetical protein
LKRITLMAGAFLLAVVSLGMSGGLLSAQIPGGVYAACDLAKSKIEAAGLPQVVDLGRCPIEGRMIVDKEGLGAVAPPPGMGVSPMLHSVDGFKELRIENPGDGTLVIEHSGREPSSFAFGTAAGGPAVRTTQALRADGCNDRAHNPDPANSGMRLFSTLNWYFNAKSTPGELSRSGVERALRKAGTNITHVQNPCGVGDGVGAKLNYTGRKDISLNMSSTGKCLRTDGRSGVGFGDLPAGSYALQCPWYVIRDGQDKIVQSDIRLNKRDVKFTGRITSNCRRRIDIESAITHERGHSYGLGHVSEDSHPHLTMSQNINRYCSKAERSLGRGDAEALNQKYR